MMIEQPAFPVTAFANRMRASSQKTAESHASNQAAILRRNIGPIGTTARLLAGLLLIGIIVYGQLVSPRGLSPITWAVGLIGFPAFALAWHFWRIRRSPARFSYTSPLSTKLSVALPLALYFTGGYVRPLWFTSDATVIFVGCSLVVAALRGYAGCELLALSNWLLRRADQIACGVFTPIDYLDQRRSRS